MKKREKKRVFNVDKEITKLKTIANISESSEILLRGLFSMKKKFKSKAKVLTLQELKNIHSKCKDNNKLLEEDMWIMRQNILNKRVDFAPKKDSRGIVGRREKKDGTVIPNFDCGIKKGYQL